MNFYHADDIPDDLKEYFVPAPQIGLEASPDAYVAKMVDVFREVRRVLRDDGTVWLNLGDSYANNGTGGNGATGGRDKSTLQSAMPPIGTTPVKKSVPDGLKVKDLIGIPWRVAFALQADGWYLRQDIIWHKPNPMPESVRDRCTKAHEYIFLLSKSERYYFDSLAMQEPASKGAAGSEFHTGKTGAHQLGRASTKPRTAGNKSNEYVTAYDGSDTEEHRTKAGLMNIADTHWETRNRRSVWTVATKPYKGAHFATFPPDLIRPCILAGCPKYTCGACGIVLDSHYEKAGSSTNGEAVRDLQVVRKQGGATPQEPSTELLQQSMCFEVGGEEPQHHERVYNHVEGVSDANASGPSERHAIRIHHGASVSDGGDFGPSSTGERSCPPQGRGPSEQRSEQSGGVDENKSRQTSKTANRDDSLPPLRRENYHIKVCPSCGSSLHEVGVKPGVVLDCFGGSGTTALVALEEGRKAVLCELNTDYITLAHKRLEGLQLRIA